MDLPERAAKTRAAIERQLRDLEQLIEDAHPRDPTILYGGEASERLRHWRERTIRVLAQHLPETELRRLMQVDLARYSSDVAQSFALATRDFVNILRVLLREIDAHPEDFIPPDPQPPAASTPGQNVTPARARIFFVWVKSVPRWLWQWTKENVALATLIATVFIGLITAGVMLFTAWLAHVDATSSHTPAPPAESSNLPVPVGQAPSASTVPSADPELPDVSFSWSDVAGEEVRLGPEVKLNDETRKGRKQYVLTIASGTTKLPVSLDVALQFRQDVSDAFVKDDSGADVVKLPPQPTMRALRKGPGAEVHANEGAAAVRRELEIGIRRLRPNGAHVAVLVELQDDPERSSQDEGHRGVPEEKIHYLWADAITELGERTQREPFYAPFITEIDGSVKMPPTVHGRGAVPKDTWSQRSSGFKGGVQLKVGAAGSTAAVLP